ncbi:MAG: histidinol-phosphate transaminase [Gammaproteobacteria bacterium]|nr:histidinol-phosphate transaminase [Gammaproteobacteria bacterium]
MLKPAPGVSRLRPYEQGQRAIEGMENPTKLSANESSHGPSPAALAAYREAVGQINRYPDGSQAELRRAIGEVHGLDPERIVCGNGSDELILLMARAYLQPGDDFLISENSFEMVRIHCLAQGGNPVVAPEREWRIDVQALIDSATEKSRLCVIANPNNPTGTYMTGQELRRLRSGLPPDCLLVIDGAYAEYVDRKDYDSGASLVDAGGNTVMTRTFSKIHGLASLRIGWAYCPPNVVDTVQRIRTPFNTNGPALVAAAAAIRDTGHVDRARRHNSAWLLRIADAIAAMGLTMAPSVANFYLIRFPKESGRSGAGAAAFLIQRGIIPRPAAANDELLRITVGLDHENEAVLAALADYMGQEEPAAPVSAASQPAQGAQ